MKRDLWIPTSPNRATAWIGRSVATILLALLPGIGWIVACAPPPSAVEVRFVDPGADELEAVKHAVAILRPLDGSSVEGVVEFEVTEENPVAGPGLHMKARFSGLPAGAHGFHVHLLGDCRGEGKRAGTHFNFSGPSRNPPEDIDRITGNLGILESGEDGQAQLEADIDDARLHGPYSILGRSIIVHARANDPKQPPIGAAGARIACGVIGLTEG
jgi:Cu-Zn family superoxide dismutase